VPFLKGHIENRFGFYSYFAQKEPLKEKNGKNANRETNAKTDLQTHQEIRVDVEIRQKVQGVADHDCQL
jgi:hypothetical protein